MRSLFLICSVLALSGCAAAQMQLPTSLSGAGAVRTEFTGITGWTHGRFAAGPYSGGYERSAERLSFPGFTDKSGHSEFTIAGPEIYSTIEGFCRMREHEIDAHFVDVTVNPMAYRCEFSADGIPIPAWLELQEVNRLAAPLNRYERRGEIALDGEIVQIRSVHHIDGSPLPTAAPIGYVFEQRGRVVGAVELNGRPVLFVPSGTRPELARTMTVAALALGVFWDPAEVDPG